MSCALIWRQRRGSWANWPGSAGLDDSGGLRPVAGGPQGADRDPAGLGAAGVKADQVPALVEIALADVCHRTNPRPCGRADFQAFSKPHFKTLCMLKSLLCQWAAQGGTNPRAEKRRGRNHRRRQDPFPLPCGYSKNKPYCDGSHTAAKFSDKRKRTKPTRGGIRRQGGGGGDQVGLCAHAGYCAAGAPHTFFTFEAAARLAPDASNSALVIAAIRRCPSGSLLYSWAASWWTTTRPARRSWWRRTGRCGSSGRS